MADSLFDVNDLDQSQEREAILAKWKDKPQDELLNSKVEADLTIKQLTARIDEMRDDLLSTKESANQQAKLQDIYDLLTNPEREQVANTPANDNANEQPRFDLSQIESLVSQKIQETEKSKKETENFTKVQNALKDKFGSNYQTILKEKVDALGLSLDDINSLARKSPNAFFNAFGLNDAPASDPFQSAPRSSGTFKPNPPQKRTRSYYLKLKQTDPKAYYDPKTYVQMERDAVTLGTDFFDVND